ncbi:hypothetical protein K493DRAFT_339446 [Basidiobolus meristosporus CBS 931.73]|uniref:Glycosyltransferase family 34 protein n=1 Tax=Basidiobolus meristosporus CBS 931.73 TaxID=1314790 RepID=A0A1Y1XZV4_9FUNG|nr:hypothetical protein K493DRAFT_339446 [Basidiobolus meristosporus CBS 931.73]|eukprot:ORX91300.1 hypothetical protein K493DRAFT_339446 [Basidiobolus meristosporus CBS 931.73]
MQFARFTPLVRNVAARAPLRASLRQMSQLPSLNKVILMGQASYPKIRDLPSGGRVVDFMLSTTHPSNNEEKTTVRYHKVKSYNSAVADMVNERLGDSQHTTVYVEGSLATRRYVDRNGETRYDTFVYGDKVVFLPLKDSESHEPAPQHGEEPTPEGWDNQSGPAYLVNLIEQVSARVTGTFKHHYLSPKFKLELVGGGTIATYLCTINYATVAERAQNHPFRPSFMMGFSCIAAAPSNPMFHIPLNGKKVSLFQVKLRPVSPGQIDTGLPTHAIILNIKKPISVGASRCPADKVSFDLRQFPSPPTHTMRRLHVSLIILFIVAGYFYFKSPSHVDEAVSPPESDLSQIPLGPTSTGYDLVVLINSETADFDNRQLLRRELFNLPNNLTPCRQLNGRIHYKFFITQGNVRSELLRRLRSEIMEYDDIVALPRMPTWEKELAMLQWVDSDQGPEEYRNAMLLDSHTYVRFDQILAELDYMAKESSEAERNQPILWGSLEAERNQTRAVILGESLVGDLLNIPDLLPPRGSEASILSHILDNRSDDLVSHISLINDNRFVEWPNNPYTVPKNSLAISMVYQPDDFARITDWFKPEQPQLCSMTRPENRIGVITSSFIYKDNCMLDASIPSTMNKRSYAKKHDYSFIARSSEFAQQVFRGRRIVWGKIDAIEKTLPEYDWLFWLDMDAVIMNEEIRVEDILEKFRQDLGDEEFSKKSLFVTKPKHDPMINAGVFLLKNSVWSFDFLREVQHRKENYNRIFYEQRAMWEVAQEPKWAEGAHIFGDSSVFNTFPEDYVPGNFVVHFAPAGCPAEQVLGALRTGL